MNGEGIEIGLCSERREVPLEIMRYSIFCIKINYGGWARISGKISLEIIIGLKGDSFVMQLHWRNHHLLTSTGCNDLLSLRDISLMT